MKLESHEHEPVTRIVEPSVALISSGKQSCGRIEPMKYSVHTSRYQTHERQSVTSLGPTVIRHLQFHDANQGNPIVSEHTMDSTSASSRWAVRNAAHMDIQIQHLDRLKLRMLTLWRRVVIGVRGVVNRRERKPW